MFADILSLIAGLRAPPARMTGAERSALGGKGELCLSASKAARFSAAAPSVARLRSPPCSGNRDLPLLQALKGAILALAGTWRMSDKPWAQGVVMGSEMAGEIIYSVFVSSTYEDLREERAAVQKALLQLKCMPIGMELFGSADEETWEFIKRQIDDCDYYVVIVAGKYGSTADDGLSYTEKEYDYAREIKKPVLGFVHGNRDGIARNKTEDDPQTRARLEMFIEKIRNSPVSFFTATDDLATKVLASFVNFRDRRPAVGFIRADQAPDLKKYSELLEENLRLRSELESIKSAEIVIFPHASEKISFTLPGDIEPIKVDVTWREAFIRLSEVIFEGQTWQQHEYSLLDRIVQLQDYTYGKFILERIFNRFVGWQLINRDGMDLSLTEYGKRQYGLLMTDT